jgi:hypothetical protein
MELYKILKLPEAGNSGCDNSRILKGPEVSFEKNFVIFYRLIGGKYLLPISEFQYL